MEMAARRDAERILENEKVKRISARQSQIRKQSQAWMNENRQNYNDQKEIQIKKLNINLASKTKAEAIKDVERMKAINTLGIMSIGTAHSAASKLPNYESIKQEKKIKNELIAKERGSTAFKKHKEIEAEKQEYIRRLQSLKERVRMEEDIKSKELADRRTFRPTSGFGNDVDNNVRKKLLSKDLYTPAAGGKENKVLKKKPSSKLDSKKKNEKIKLVAERPLPIKNTGSFAKVAKKKEDNIKSPAPNSSKSKSYKLNKNLSIKQKVVTYYDDSLPDPPQFFKQPKGIVKREEKKPENSWTDTKKLEKDKKINEVSKDRDETVRRQKAQERGLRAMKLTLLEKKIKEISIDANDKCLENISLIDKEDNQSLEFIKDEIQENVEKIKNDSSNVSFISWDAHDDDEINKPPLPLKNEKEEEVVQKYMDSEESLSNKKSKLNVNYDEKIDGNESDSSTGYLSFEEGESIFIQDQNDKKSEIHLESVKVTEEIIIDHHLQSNSFIHDFYPVTSTPQTSISKKTSNTLTNSISLSSEQDKFSFINSIDEIEKKLKLRNSLKKYIKILFATEPERIKEDLGVSSSSSSSSATRDFIATDTECRLTIFDDISPIKVPKSEQNDDDDIDDQNFENNLVKKLDSSTATIVETIHEIPAESIENELILSDISEEKVENIKLNEGEEISIDSSKNSSNSTIAEVKYIMITPTKSKSNDLIETDADFSLISGSTLAEVNFLISPNAVSSSTPLKSSCSSNSIQSERERENIDNFNQPRIKQSASETSFYYSCVEDNNEKKIEPLSFEIKNPFFEKYEGIDIECKDKSYTSIISSKFYFENDENEKEEEKRLNSSLESLKIIKEENQTIKNEDSIENLASKKKPKKLCNEEMQRYKTIEEYLNFSLPEFKNLHMMGQMGDDESEMISQNLKKDWEKLEIERSPRPRYQIK